MPALLTRMSTRPHSPIAACTIAWTAAKSVTDAALAIALPPAARISSTTALAAVGVPPLPSSVPPRSLTTTAAPRAASARACSRPRPPPAPVTIATRPSNRIDICFFSEVKLKGGTSVGSRRAANRARPTCASPTCRRAKAAAPRRSAPVALDLALVAALTARSACFSASISVVAASLAERLVALGPRQGELLALADHAEIDLAAVEVDPADLHPDPAADDVAHAGALAAQLLLDLVEAEVLAAELGDVHQALDVEAVEGDEQAEAGDRADRAAVLLAEVLAHVAALEPGLDVARGLVGTALVGAAMRAGDFPGLELAAGHQHRRGRQALRLLGVLRGLRRLGRLGGHRPGVAGARGELVALAADQRLDDAMHQQVGIAADRAGEVGVGLVGQAEVAGCWCRCRSPAASSAAASSGSAPRRAGPWSPGRSPGTRPAWDRRRSPARGRAPSGSSAAASSSPASGPRAPGTAPDAWPGR